MKDDNKKSNSLLPVNSEGLARVEKSIIFTKKIISQGFSVERNYNRIYIIPFKKETGYFLLNKKTNSIIFGPFKSISRNKEFIICLDFNRRYLVFKNEKYLFEFSELGGKVISLSSNFAPPFRIIENKYIVIFYYGASYVGKYISDYHIVIEGVFDFEGTKIEYPLSVKELEVIINQDGKEDLKISETLWEANETTLKFKNKVILSIEDIEEISVSDFHYGYARVKEVAEYDPEFGEKSNDIGYIDVFGNIYWEPELKFGWG